MFSSTIRLSVRTNKRAACCQAIQRMIFTNARFFLSLIDCHTDFCSFLSLYHRFHLSWHCRHNHCKEGKTVHNTDNV